MNNPGNKLIKNLMLSFKGFRISPLRVLPFSLLGQQKANT